MVVKWSKFIYLQERLIFLTKKNKFHEAWAEFNGLERSLNYLQLVQILKADSNPNGI